MGKVVNRIWNLTLVTWFISYQFPMQDSFRGEPIIMFLIVVDSGFHKYEKRM